MRNFLHFLILLILLLNNRIDAQWVSTAQFPSSGGGVYSITVSRINIFAGTFNGGVFVTINDGESWAEANSGLTNSEIWSLAVSGSNLFAGTGSGVFLSTDNGSSWTEKKSGLTDAIVYSFAISDTNLFAGTGDGVFLTTDNGTNWTEVSSGLPNNSVRAIAVSGSNLFAGVGFGIYLSTNSGTNWTPVSSGLPNNTTIYSLAASGTVLFAGTNGGGVYISTNNGTNWNEANINLTNIVIWSFAVTGNNVFAGTDDGVFLTTDNGASWSNTEYNLISAYALAVSEINLFGGGGFSRVSKRPLSEIITNTEFRSEGFPSEYKLGQNYPNPFNPSTVISWQLPVSGLVSLKVYDILGNEAVTLVNEEKPAGVYKITYDASGLPSGVYFYKLQTGEFIETKKMILVR